MKKIQCLFFVSILVVCACSNETKKMDKPKEEQKTKIENPKKIDGLFISDGLVIVNKKYNLPANYDPGEDEVAGQKIRTMIQDMKKAGLDVNESYSGYRSYAYQKQLYQEYIDAYGKEEADTFSARPGYSEHQTGLTFDLLYGNGTLIDSGEEAMWIEENAQHYGFIIRYQKGKENLTGYQPEPWHLRYVGDCATEIKNSGLTLEEFLKVDGGDYERNAE